MAAKQLSKLSTRARPFTRSIFYAKLRSSNHTMNDTCKHTLELSDSAHSLTAVSGEVILLSGDSGCGKTGWLKRLAGLTDLPAGADVRIDGTDPNKHHIRMLFDRWPCIWLGQSVAEEICFGLKKRPAQQELKQALLSWGLAELTTETGLETLTRLQALRLSLTAMTLAKPALLLLDNPTASLSKTDARSVVDDVACWAKDSDSIIVVACNRWQDWQPAASQEWCLSAPDALPQLKLTQ
ncbi:MAG: ATP-binding cassette domain-containing protein [Mariprofundus sp.]